MLLIDTGISQYVINKLTCHAYLLISVVYKEYVIELQITLTIAAN